jgi:predicted ATP-dependent protease
LLYFPHTPYSQFFSVLYNYDEDFKKIFKIRAEYEPIIDINNDTKNSFINNIAKLIEANNLNPMTDEAIGELAKFLSRKAENKNKMYLNDYENAYSYYIETIKSKRDFIIPIYSIAHILNKEKAPLEQFKNTIENFFVDYPKAYAVIADIFYYIYSIRHTK